MQQGVSPVLHDGRPVPHELLGMRPKAMSVATTTPIGWNVLNAASKKRRFWQWLSAFCGANGSRETHFGKELERYRRVDGYVAAHTKSDLQLAVNRRHEV